MSDLEAAWKELVSGRNCAWWAYPARGALRGLGTLYGSVIAGYRLGFDLGWKQTTRLPCRVVSVGNITVGGTGKTTTVRWLARRLREWNVRPAVLSYGYRAGKDEGGGKRDRNRVTVVAGPDGLRVPVEVSGDEPRLLAQSLPGVPVLTGRKRILSGQRAWDEFRIDVCVLDDAYQYWKLEKDLEIVLINATNPFGYGHVFPRGMLREPLRGLRRADAALITHAAWANPEEREALHRQLRRWNKRMVIAEARHVPTRLRDHRTGALLPLEHLRNGRWLALSGLGEPELFERTLRDQGVREISPARFPDHHPYTEGDLQSATARVRSEGLAGVVTTEKDGVKIAPEWLGETPCLVLEIDLEFLSGQADLEALLRNRVVESNRDGATGPREQRTE